MKRFFCILTTILLSLTSLFTFGCGKSETTININEVTHSVFYTPLYLAIENGYFKEEDININLTNGGGADNSMTAVLSKTADIGLMGPETVIYVYNQGKKDCPKVFAQLTQRDGAFLVSRNEEANFSWEDLRNKEILAGRRGGVPAMSFEYILKNMGFNTSEYTLNYSVQFNMMTSAFIGGTADYCTVFEPTASEYEKNGTWHIVASVGEKSGELPYTSFIALSSYLNNNKETVKKFLSALKKGIEYLSTHTELEVAQCIVKQFPSTTINSLETSIKNYKKIDAWKLNLETTKTSIDNLQNIMISAGELTTKVDYDKIVDCSLVKEVFS